MKKYYLYQIHVRQVGYYIGYTTHIRKTFDTTKEMLQKKIYPGYLLQEAHNHFAHRFSYDQIGVEDELAKVIYQEAVIKAQIPTNLNKRIPIQRISTHLPITYKNKTVEIQTIEESYLIYIIENKKILGVELKDSSFYDGLYDVNEKGFLVLREKTDE